MIIPTLQYCGEFKHIASFSKPNAPRGCLVLVDEIHNCEHLVAISNTDDWKRLPLEIQDEELKDLLLSNNAKTSRFTITAHF